jgi:hypothetical protein
MSYNGSGTFNINTAGQPVVTGTTITSTAFNLLTADLATGLSTALTKDGQSTPTANIPMGSFKITGLGAGTAATDAAQYGQLQAGATTIATVTGTDTYVGTLSPAIAAYATGNLFSFVAPNTNTGAATINLNSLGAKNITKLGSTALAAGDIVSGRVYQIEYDGTRFQLLNPSASTVASFSAGSTGFTPSSATTGAVTLAGTLATTNGGTGLTSFTANGVLYASSSSALTSGSALTFDGTNLGVGVSSASFALDVGGANGTNIALRSTGTSSARFRAYVNSAESGVIGFLNGGGQFFEVAGTEQMRLTSTGLGIGTSSPYNNGAGQGALEVKGSNYPVISASTSSISSYLGVGASSGYVGTRTNHNFSISTNDTPRATFDTSGNLGLGVTPSAWLSGMKSIQANKATFSGYATYAYVWANAYLNSAGNPYYIADGYASYNVQVNGQHQWYTAASGTAGNAITFTQALTLDSSGNLLIGTTSATGARLTVASTVNTQSEILQLNASSGDVYGKQIVISQNKSDTTSRYLSCETNNGNTAKLYIYSNGNVVNANNSYGSLSDAKLKENIVDASPKLTGLMQVKVRNYNLIGDTTKQIGVVAQELETVFPSMIDISPDIDKDGNDLGTTTKSVKYSVFVPMLIKAIQEQQAIIVSLQARLDAANL